VGEGKGKPGEGRGREGREKTPDRASGVV